jgi:hypothetical protein
MPQRYQKVGMGAPGSSRGTEGLEARAERTEAREDGLDG